MDSSSGASTIVAFVVDLFFVSRIESAAKGLGFEVSWVENATQVAPSQPEIPGRQIGEHLTGAGATLIDLLTRLHPVLLIFDLGNAGIPWHDWLPVIKSAPATRRIPVICYGSHVDAATMNLARSSGAELVVARSRFVQSLPELIGKYARIFDKAALGMACQDKLSALAIQGLEEFNRGEYFEAHESLEAAWKEDSTPGRELYRAILQVAVAYLQIERGNHRGAMKMFLRVRQWIDPIPDVCRGVEIAALRQDAYQVHARLSALGGEGIGFIERELLKPVKYKT